MAYSTANPPALICQKIGGSDGGGIYYYRSGDALALVLAAGYFSNGYDLGMRIGDIVAFVDEPNGQTRNLVVTVANPTTGAVTVSAAATSINSSGVLRASVAGANLALSAADSGKTILMDRAAGCVVALPAPVVGLRFKVVHELAVTSNSYQVTTGGGGVFLVGNLETIIAGAATTFGGVANGTSTTSVSSNGTTSGGLVGGVIEIECISLTKWAVNGILVGSGTLITPFA